MTVENLKHYLPPYRLPGYVFFYSTTAGLDKDNNIILWLTDFEL